MAAVPQVGQHPWQCHDGAGPSPCAPGERRGALFGIVDTSWGFGLQSIMLSTVSLEALGGFLVALGAILGYLVTLRGTLPLFDSLPNIDGLIFGFSGPG